MSIRKNEAERHGKSVVTREAQERRLVQLLEETNTAIDELKVAWEKYFLGIEKRPPERETDNVKRMFIEIEKNRSLKTALKFKTQVLRDRWTSLRLYWMRSQKQIEEGTHLRQKRLVEYRERQRTANGEAPTAPDPKRPSAPDPGSTAAAASGGHNAGSFELFKDFIATRAQCGEKVQGLTPDRLSKQLEAQAEMIRQKTGARNVQFKVVVENGKTKVKAVTS